MEVLIVLVLVIAGWIVVSKHFKNKKVQIRRDTLMQKYSDASIVKRIMEGRVWQGQTAEQLRDAIGRPVGIDRHDTKEVWKYRQQGSVAGLRIALEHDVVVGWQ